MWLNKGGKIVKRKGIAYLLLFFLCISSIGTIPSYAEQVQDNKAIEDIASDNSVELEGDFQENKVEEAEQEEIITEAVSYTHLTLPTTERV